MRMLRLYIFVILLSFSALISSAGDIEKTDYIQIILYGQSLSMGWEAPRAITTDSISGNYMLGSSPLVRGWEATPNKLNPLVATVWNNGGEQPIVSCVNVFSNLYRQNLESGQKFIGVTGGEGGQTIEKLSKECTNNGYYQSSFVKILDGTKAALGNEKTVSCPAVIFMQGEYNCNEESWYKNQGLMPGTNGTTDKNEYKRLLLILKNNMQNDIMQKYGQSQKPLFFIYQTSGWYLREKEMPISMAQYEFAEENDDVVFLNPHYALPDYGGGHLSTNGYRWYGEIMGKILYDELVDKKPYTPVYPKNFTVKDDSLTIEFHVPSPPLVLDTWTNAKASYYGFSVYKNGSTVLLKSVELKDNDKVVITANDHLTGEIEVVYAGNKTSGTGNLRDSYEYASMYRYFDDFADSKKETYTPKDMNGIKIYGQHYPMYNWSAGFYKKINQNSSSISTNAGSRISIYPNPAKDFIEIASIPDNSIIRIVDATGKVVETMVCSNEPMRIALNLSRGIYFIKIENDKSFMIEKLIVE